MKKVLKSIIPLILLALGVAGALAIMSSAPEISRAKPTIVVPVVETEALTPIDYQVEIRANGTVIPARTVSLKAQVSGEIIRQNTNLIPGGHLGAGDEIVRIDPRDYGYSVIQQKEAVANAEYKLKLEAGQQEIAREEWTMFGDGIPTTEEGKALALREPQMEVAKAALESARSKLQKAELDLERTVIKAPFNALVLAENVETGQLISANSDLATLVSTDYFWIQVSVPYDKLAKIRIPAANGRGQGSLAEITLESGSVVSRRTGRVVRLLSDLEEAGRMARLLIQIDDPLALNPETAGSGQALPLLLGSYVDVTIKSDELSGVFAIPLKALRDNGDQAAGTETGKALIWILSTGNTLEEREIELAWQNDRYAYATGGVSSGEKLIVSSVLAPLKGMDLRERSESGSEDLPMEQAAPGSK